MSSLTVFADQMSGLLGNDDSTPMLMKKALQLRMAAGPRWAKITKERLNELGVMRLASMKSPSTELSMMSFGADGVLAGESNARRPLKQIHLEAGGNQSTGGLGLVLPAGEAIRQWS